jgi:hypothetical protein
VAVDAFQAALETIYPGRADEIEVIDFFGQVSQDAQRGCIRRLHG